MESSERTGRHRKASKLDDAATPISGAHSVPHSARPQATRSRSARGAKRNWQGAGIVIVAALLFAAALVAFTNLRGPVQPDNAVEGNQTRGENQAPGSGSSAESPGGSK